MVMSSSFDPSFADLVLEFIGSFCLLADENILICKAMGGVSLITHLRTIYGHCLFDQCRVLLRLFDEIDITVTSTEHSVTDIRQDF